MITDLMFMLNSMTEYTDIEQCCKNLFMLKSAIHVTSMTLTSL